MTSSDDIHHVLTRLNSARNGTAAEREEFLDFLVNGSEAPGEQEAPVTPDLRVGALLRLMAIDDRIVYDSPHRREALKLIEERVRQRSKSLLERYGLNGKRQADEQCRMLASFAPDAEADLDAAASTYKGISSLERVRERLLKSLNADLAKPTVQPFLLLGVDPGEQLRSCLSLAIEYSNAGPSDAAQKLDAAKAAIEQILGSDPDQLNDVFRPIARLLASIRDDLTEDYQASPYSKPADLMLGASVRRHPLHVENLELAIPLVLKNVGDGVALDVEVEMTDAIGLIPNPVPTRVQRVEPGNMVIEVRAHTNPAGMKPNEDALGAFNVSWGNADGTVSAQELELFIRPQDWTVDWESLQENDPYSLAAVDSEAHLVGRGRFLKRISGTLTTKNIGSLYIHGQKRVGKTSLAQVALNQMKGRSPELTCILEDIGGYPATAGGAVDTLVKNLVQALDDLVGIPQNARDFTPDGSLSPLISILKSLSRANKRIVIALDEFDRLPVTLFRRNEQGDSFFTGLRSISNIDGVGLILIGGERMRLIINAGGVELNKFEPVPLDYLDRATQWAEFEELVRNPTEGRLEFTDDACSLIYEYTAGNPYYTKWLCGQILESATTRRDAYVDSREVEGSVEMLLGRIDSAAFAHYWEDFMLEQDEKRDEITLHRRRCLKAIGLAQRPGLPVQIDDVVTAAGKVSLDPVATIQEIDGLVSRGLFTRSGDTIVARVRLFERWLNERGEQQIVLAGAELEAPSQVAARREAFRVGYDEAEKLVGSWGAYGGRAISAEQLLQYLKQFETLEDQRLMFKTLGAVKFIDDAAMNQMFRTAWTDIGNVLKAADGTWKQSQIRLSYFGGPGKSSLASARAFAAANKLLKDSRGIVGPEALRDLVASGLKDIILVDDFVGTGESICDALPTLVEQVPDNVRVHVVVVAGMAAGIVKVDSALRDAFGDRVAFHPLLEVEEQSSVFGPETTVFSSAREAADALNLLKRFGELLLPNAPLGFGKTCSLVTFSTTIPNNAPPVLWKNSTGKFTFSALFPRP
jgi:hypothetical protein